MLKLILKVLLLLPVLTLGVTEAKAQLLGDWGGVRPTLEEHGVTADAVLTTDFLYNAAGGISQDGTILGNIDLTFEIDTKKAGWWDNGTLFFYFLGNFNTNGFMTEIVGDLQTSSNIEARENFKLFEAWYEHRFYAGRFSILFGLHDFNSEFDALEYGGLFINSSFGISPDISQNGPSIFPSAALGLRFKAELTDKIYVMTAIYDGVPDDSNSAPRTGVSLKEEDGIFSALELGLTDGATDQSNYYKLAIGGWIHTAEVENFNGQVHDFNRGIYLIAEKRLTAEASAEQGLGAFFQFGLADRELNQITSYWGAGLHYTGLLPSRNADIFGLAIANAAVGEEYINHSREIHGVDIDHNETAIELSYRAEVSSWLTVQPDIQYIINPSMDPELDEAFQLGVRLEIIF